MPNQNISDFYKRVGGVSLVLSLERRNACGYQLFCSQGRIRTYNEQPSLTDGLGTVPHYAPDYP